MTFLFTKRLNNKVQRVKLRNTYYIMQICYVFSFV